MDLTTDDTTELGVLLPTGTSHWEPGTEARALIDFAVRAEQLGLDSVWANDSLLSPRIEALTVLAALAATTERVTLGTGALLPVLRRPVQAAQTLASVDALSGGRLVLGVGAGFPGRFGRPLHILSEVPWERRFARLDDTVALWRQLWTTDAPSSFHGELLHFDDLPQGTSPHRPGGPPIWLGAAAPTALVRTGRLYDGWLPYPPDPAAYGSGLDAVRAAATEAGRAPEAITPAVYVTVLIDDDPEHGRAALDAFARANYGMPLEELETIQSLVTGPPAAVAAHLARYTAQGARHVVCRLGAPGLHGQREQLERLAEVQRLLGAVSCGAA